MDEVLENMEYVALQLFCIDLEISGCFTAPFIGCTCFNSRKSVRQCLISFALNYTSVHIALTVIF